MGQNRDEKGAPKKSAYYTDGVWAQIGFQARRGSGNSVVDGEAGVALGTLHVFLNKDKGVYEPGEIFAARVKALEDFNEICYWQQKLFKDNFPIKFKKHMDALGHNLFNLGDAIGDTTVAALQTRVPGFKREDLSAWNVAATIRSPQETATLKHTDNNTRRGKTLTYQMAFTSGSRGYVGQRIYLVCSELVDGDKKLLCHSRVKPGCQNGAVIVALTKKYDSSLFTAQVPHFLPRFVALSPAELASLLDRMDELD